ncbi:MAG: hypothetical protein ACOC35_02335 [Promethearchaeia archaeon]
MGLLNDQGVQKGVESVLVDKSSGGRIIFFIKYVLIRGGEYSAFG